MTAPDPIYREALGKFDPDDAWDLYIEAKRAEAMTEYEAGSHDYTDFEEFFADGDVVDYDDFAIAWRREQEQIARERRHR
jgi:hypothetical protein